MCRSTQAHHLARGQVHDGDEGFSPTSGLYHLYAGEDLAVVQLGMPRRG